MIRRFLPVWVLLLFTLTAAAQSSDAHLRIGHFTLDTGALDIYLDGTLYLEGVTLATMSEWRDIPAGVHNVTITMQGASVETPLMTPSQILLNGDEWVTLAVVGRRAPGTLRLQALLENYSPIRSGETRLTVFHAFYPNPPINVTANGTPIIVGLAYPGTLDANDGLETVNMVARNRYDLAISLIDGTPIKTIPLGMGQYRHYFIGLTGTMDNPIAVLAATHLTPAGTATAVPTEAVVITAESAIVTEEAIVTEAAAVTAAPTETLVPEPTPVLTATPVRAASGQTLLRVGHFSPGAPDFSIYLNGQELLPLLPYPTLSDYLAVDAGTYEMAVVIEGEPLDSAVLRQTVTVPAGGIMTVMAVGSLDTGTFQLQPVEEDYSTLRPGLARIAIFHAVPDAPFLNLIANDLLLVERVAFPGVFEGGGDGFFSVDVLATDYSLSAELSDQVTVNMGNLRMGAGRYYFIVIAGTVDTAFFVLKSSAIADIRRDS